MATVSNVAISLSNGSSSSNRTVTVTGTMNFDASEVGKLFRMSINVMGEDKAGDNLPAGDSASDDDVYTFTWGSLLNQKSYKQFTVNVPGSQTFTESRTVLNDKLDEDKGKVIVGQADINTPIYMPRQDEIYALVTLSTIPATAKSATIIAGIGV
jgi:hypothetical protein